jgi:hypothetical protein
MTSVTLPQLGPAAPYARLKAAWDNRATYRDAVKAWRRISSSKFLTPPESNAKLAKGSAKGWHTLSLSLAPADMSGIEVCPGSTVECRKSCIGHSAGCARRYPAVVQARIKRTRFLFEQPEAALTLITYELLQWRAKLGPRAKIAVRLNAFSDIAWEVLLPGLIHYIKSLRIRQYDYTKLPARFLKPTDNYDLTLSYSGHNWYECKDVLESGGRVAMVFAGWMPKEFAGYRVINGDAHDLRFLDPKGVIVGLRLKGVSASDASVFAIRKDAIFA